MGVYRKNSIAATDTQFCLAKLKNVIKGLTRIFRFVGNKFAMFISSGEYTEEILLKAVFGDAVSGWFDISEVRNKREFKPSYRAKGVL